MPPSKKRRLGLRAHHLEFYFRRLAEPRVWGASKEDWERLGQSLQDADKRFYCFADPGGVTVCVNLAQVQLVRCSWETGAVTTITPRQAEVPDGLRITLDGRPPVLFLPTQPENLSLAADLEDLEDEDAVHWFGEGELVALRLDEVVFLEYPSSWDAETR